MSYVIAYQTKYIHLTGYQTEILVVIGCLKKQGVQSLPK